MRVYKFAFTGTVSAFPSSLYFLYSVLIFCVIREFCLPEKGGLALLVGNLNIVHPDAYQSSLPSATVKTGSSLTDWYRGEIIPSNTDGILIEPTWMQLECGSDTAPELTSLSPKKGEKCSYLLMFLILVTTTLVIEIGSLWKARVLQHHRRWARIL